MSWLVAVPIIGDIIKGAENIIDQYVIDKDKALEGKLKLKNLELEYAHKAQQLEAQELQNQQEVNKIEASSPDSFSRRARPATLWICNAALGYYFIFHPMLQWYLALRELAIVAPELPNVEYLFVLLSALLGVGGMRSFDKWKVGPK